MQTVGSGSVATDSSASLPFYVFDDGQRPKSKKDLKRQKSLIKVRGRPADRTEGCTDAEQVEGEEEDGPNKRAK